LIQQQEAYFVASPQPAETDELQKHFAQHDQNYVLQSLKVEIKKEDGLLSAIGKPRASQTTPTIAQSFI